MKPLMRSLLGLGLVLVFQTTAWAYPTSGASLDLDTTGWRTNELTVGGDWIYDNIAIVEGNWMPIVWSFEAVGTVDLFVTDWAHASDTFVVYEFNPETYESTTGTVTLLGKSSVPDVLDTPTQDPWAEPGFQIPGDLTLDQAFADSRFSSGKWRFDAGWHQIVVFTTHIPTNPETGEDYTDATVAMKVAPVPEPATLLLFGAGMAGIAAIRRRQK